MPLDAERVARELGAPRGVLHLGEAERAVAVRVGEPHEQRELLLAEAELGPLELGDLPENWRAVSETMHVSVGEKNDSRTSVSRAERACRALYLSLTLTRRRQNLKERENKHREL